MSGTMGSITHTVLEWGGEDACWWSGERIIVHGVVGGAHHEAHTDNV